jgi:hypothetical protein
MNITERFAEMNRNELKVIISYYIRVMDLTSM